MNDKLKAKLDAAPTNPGCYIYRDVDGNILYVGKAKNITNRVHQYFDRVYNNKTANLVKQIDDVEFVITLSEKEALVLEINLIKQYMPPFNIIFMDDKHYPYIALSKEVYPKLSIRRDVKNKKYKYYGPFPDSSAAYNVINLLNNIYPFRKCNKIPSKPCLYFHIGQCLGPCVNKLNEDAYKDYTKEVDKFFKGNTAELISSLKERMYAESELLNFEKANEYKNLIEQINNITSKQVIEFNDKVSRDVIGFYVKDSYVSISTLMYRNGYLNAKINDIADFVGDINDIVSTYLMQFYENHDMPKEIYMASDINLSMLSETLGIDIITPKAGIGQELIVMAIENAKKSLETKIIELASKDEDIFMELGSYLNMNRVSSIEMCDNSHISGDSAVGVVIVFVNGYPVKNKYRKFNIKQDNKADDVASTYEVIYRRFYNLLKDGLDYSDLLIVDGGITQMNAARKALDDLGITSVKVCGLAKDDNHRTRCLITPDNKEIELKTDSKLFLFLMKMQDEVHRFAITFFRNKKTKSMISSILDQVEGLGDKRKERLLSIYQSIEEIKKAPIEQLSQIIPNNVAIELKKVLNEK